MRRVAILENLGPMLHTDGKLALPHVSTIIIVFGFEIIYFLNVFQMLEMVERFVCTRSVG